jgi:hypothetical protein
MMTDVQCDVPIDIIQTIAPLEAPRQEQPACADANTDPNCDGNFFRGLSIAILGSMIFYGLLGLVIWRIWLW